MADWTQFVLWFFIYSFIGWVYETILCSVMQRTFVNRGTLNGPCGDSARGAGEVPRVR